MPLYIRDDEVDRLAVELQQMTRAPSKTAAVREALKAQIARKREEIPLEDSIRDLQRRVRELGPGDPDFDMKAFTDDLSGGV